MQTKPFAHPYFRRRDGRSIRAHASAYSYTPPQISHAYGVPAGLDGRGVTVGIIELGGSFSQSDYAIYMKSLGLMTAPPVTVVHVAGGTQQSDPGGADVEVMMDVEIVAAIAPNAAIRLYFAPNTDTGFVAAVQQAAKECDVVSISWGAPESQWSASSRAAMDAAIQAAVNAGVNVYVAAGDNGSSDGLRGNNADYPTSSPYAIGCGGTALVLQNGVIVSESVWNDNGGGATGGGYSAVYPKPAYQGALVPGSMRGVPDVAGVADPETGWIVRANGQTQVVGGTSAVAPMWAAINALMIQANGGKRFPAASLFYQHPEAFRDIILGSNGAYKAGPGWDETTGLGTPDGAKLFALLTGVAPAPPPVSPPLPPPVSPPPPPPTRRPVLPCLSDLEAHVFGLPPGSILKVLKGLAPVVKTLLPIVLSSLEQQARADDGEQKERAA